METLVVKGITKVFVDLATNSRVQAILKKLTNTLKSQVNHVLRNYHSLSLHRPFFHVPLRVQCFTLKCIMHLIKITNKNHQT